MRTLLEPHENVRGAERDAAVLTSASASALASTLGGHLFSATLVGNQAPRIKDLYARMSHPINGDLVVVLDARYSSDPDTMYKSVGYLVTERKEWGETAQQWTELLEEDGALTEDDRWVEPQAWYIQYGPHAVDVCRWTNCHVIAIPDAGEHWG